MLNMRQVGIIKTKCNMKSKLLSFHVMDSKVQLLLIGHPSTETWLNLLAIITYSE